MAVAASMLTAAYYMLRDDQDYRELGTHYFDHMDKAKAANRVLRWLQDLGYQVEIKPAA
jgi:transposase